MDISIADVFLRRAKNNKEVREIGDKIHNNDDITYNRLKCITGSEEMSHIFEILSA
uniref:hypothetical protein n=1 Tax=Eubacterium cellulosolvens TaxID=29322 RepID=UPI0012DCCBEA|nr:hypothetical protein [[Eubacterium] cellulosolvens]